jgi:hypothetical protein
MLGLRGRMLRLECGEADVDVAKRLQATPERRGSRLFALHEKSVKPQITQILRRFLWVDRAAVAPL